ncbi:AAA family ATPase [Skermania sp. ID1734]|uniref:LuxR C-terminal-related transcriptional regulator n=1 Tax=Skermania sp. ID1734 TaxID=2597516 RepID=UPI0011806DAB|nr:LuxR C-terminal-related transcriptional regulator [Skermania sp. ID1734]TSD94074.1 AAA family ATPase [Skermania sp. ID1734]
MTSPPDPHLRRRTPPPPMPQTRFRPPVASKTLVPRTRLLADLRAGGRARLTVIHAPAGYGKSTLAAQWCEALAQEDAAIAWLSVDTDDNAVVWFLMHLIEAIRRVQPALAAELGQVLEDHGGDAERYVLTTLINDIDEHGRRFALIIDDWHRVTSPETIAALGFLIENSSHNLQIVVTSRTQAGLPLSALRIRGDLIEIDAAALRFDTSESRSLLVDLGGLSLESDSVAELTDTTDGWVAALQLAALSLRGRRDPAEFVRTMSGRHHTIAEFLAENVLDTLEPDILDFLLATCVPERLNGDLAASLAGNRRGQLMLERVEERDLFLLRLDEDGEWFRYHHLFADYLRRRLERDDPDRIQRLNTVAAQWFARHGMIKEAVVHYCAAGDVEHAVDLVEREAMVLVEHSRMVDLLGLVGLLPVESVGDQPTLLTAIAWANCLLQRPNPAQHSLDRLREFLARTPVDAAINADTQCEADVVQACIDVYGDRLDRASALVGPALEQAEDGQPFVVAVAANIDSFVDIQNSRFAAALTRQRWARPYQYRSRGPFVGVYGQCFSGIAAFAALDLDAAERYFNTAVDLARDLAGPHSHAAQLAGALLGDLRYERNDLDGAAMLLEESQELGAESGVVEFMQASYGTLARIRALAGDRVGALDLLSEGAAVADRLHLPRLASRIGAERVRILLQAGQIRDARRAADALPSGAGGRGGVAATIMHTRKSSEAMVLSAEGDHAAAIGHLTRLVDELTRLGQLRAAVTARAQLAVAYQEAGRPHQAMRALGVALCAASRARLRRSVLDAGPGLLPVLGNISDATRAGRWPVDAEQVPPDYLAELIAAGAAESSGATARTLSPELRELSAREIDVLRLLAAGLTNQDIAERLSLTVNTVKWYLKKIYATLGVTNRTESVAAAHAGGLLN